MNRGSPSLSKHSEMLGPAMGTMPSRPSGLARISHSFERIEAPNQRKFFCEKDFAMSRSGPMPTQCSAERFDFGIVEGRAVEAAFDAGLVTSDAGGLLLRSTDRAIGLVDRFAACFRDYRCQELIEHTVSTLVGQRVFGIALGYED